MVEFSKCDVFLPTLEKSNWTAEKSDFDRIIDIFGKDATLADFFNEDYVKELEVCNKSATFTLTINIIFY